MMNCLFSMPELLSSAALVHQTVKPTPTYNWPLLSQRLGCKVWVKHENHTPTGAFKVRGGLVYLQHYLQENPHCLGVVSATRGNHGQSIALSAALHNRTATIVVPDGNSIEKNAAMQALGAELIIEGQDFDESRSVAAKLANTRDLHLIPSFHSNLVMGVASYALEMFQDAPELDAVYVPLGMGSGICAMITVRDLLGLKTDIIGVCSSAAQAYALSFESAERVTTSSANTFADGLACREPNLDALTLIRQGASRIVTVSDDEIAQAIRVYFSDTHNLSEGAGAAPLAALMQEQKRQQGRKVGVVLSGGNIDSTQFATVMSGATPHA
jgi:threonine dehydratase